MPKFTLSKPQRMLLGLAIVLFIVSIVWISYFVIRSITKNLSRGINISYASISPRDTEGAETQSLAFDEPISLGDGEAILTWNGNKLYVFGPANLTISGNSVNLSSGFAYLEPGTTVNLNLNSHQLPITGAAGLYDSTIPGYIITDGQLKLDDSETAKANDTILYDGAKFTTASFDRASLQSDKWMRILNLLAEKSHLPTTLADVVAPGITNIQPADGSNIDADTVTVTGKTEPNLTLTIRDKSVTSDGNGDFQQALNLVTGKNNVVITVVDAAGNRKSVTQVYNRTSSGAALSQCNQSDFAGQMLCLINNYRQSQHLNQLTLNTQLNTAAQNHSVWMDQHTALDHTEDNGSTPFTRCNSAGTTCTAENIAQTSSPSAQAFFDLWKASAEHNANMLGNHTQMGAGVSGQYATTVFH